MACSTSNSKWRPSRSCSTTRGHPVCCQSRWKIRAGPMRRVVNGGELALGVGREEEDGLGQPCARDQQGVELAGLLQLVESPQGGEDPLPGSPALPAVLDDLEVGACTGGLGPEEHGALEVGTP